MSEFTHTQKMMMDFLKHYAPQMIEDNIFIINPVSVSVKDNKEEMEKLKTICKEFKELAGS